MRTRFLKAGALAATALVGLMASQAVAGGFYLQEQSARGAGRAFSGEVADKGAASLWWNPASIARSGREVTFGVHYIAPSADLKNSGTSAYLMGNQVPVANTKDVNDVISSGVAPNSAYVHPVNDKLTLAISVAAPYNFTTKVGADTFARYSNLKSRVTNVDVQGTVAYKATEWLDLGFGISASYMDANLQSALLNLPGQPDGKETLKGDAWDFGYTLGAQGHFDGIDVGLSYRSAIKHDLDGNVTVEGLSGPLAVANFSQSGKANFTTPDMWIFGVRAPMTDKLTFNAMVQRTGWSNLDAIRINVTGHPVPNPVMNYRDVTSYAFGLDYVHSPKWTFRGGVQFDPTPTPDKGRDARVPDADRVIIGLGGTYNHSDKLGFDFALSHAQFDKTNINTDAVTSVTTVKTRGTADGEAWIFSAATRFKF